MTTSESHRLRAERERASEMELPESLDTRARAYIEAARRRELAARQLSRRRVWVPALQLHLEAALLLMRAKLAAAGDRRQLAELSPAVLFDALVELLNREGVPAAPELERLRPLFLARAGDVLDGLEERDAERTAHELDLATRFLAGTIPIIQQAERRRERRWFAAGMALLCSGAIAALIWSLTRPTNWALNRPVTSSAPGFETRADEAVNGVRFGEVGYHSASEESPWLQVDLETEHIVHRIQIYGRGDCCFGQSIPMVVEGSIDGNAYFKMGLLDQPFHAFRPWVLTPRAASVRYVRVRTSRRAHLVVAELEVY